MSKIEAGAPKRKDLCQCGARGWVYFRGKTTFYRCGKCGSEWPRVLATKTNKLKVRIATLEAENESLGEQLVDAAALANDCASYKSRAESDAKTIKWHRECCVALEALAVELAANLKAAEISVDAYGCQTPVGFIADECAALVASIKRALSSPLLAELLVREGDEPADCTSCGGSGEISYPLMEDGSVDFISGRHVGFMGGCQDCGGTGKQEAGR